MSSLNGGPFALLLSPVMLASVSCWMVGHSYLTRADQIFLSARTAADMDAFRLTQLAGWRWSVVAIGIDAALGAVRGSDRPHVRVADVVGGHVSVTVTEPS